MERVVEADLLRSDDDANSCPPNLLNESIVIIHIVSIPGGVTGNEEYLYSAIHKVVERVHESAHPPPGDERTEYNHTLLGLPKVLLKDRVETHFIQDGRLGTKTFVNRRSIVQAFWITDSPLRGQLYNCIGSVGVTSP